MTRLARAFISFAIAIAAFFAANWMFKSKPIIAATTVFSTQLTWVLAYAFAYFVNIYALRLLERRFGNSIWEE